MASQVSFLRREKGEACVRMGEDAVKETEDEGEGEGTRERARGYLGGQRTASGYDRCGA